MRCTHIALIKTSSAIKFYCLSVLLVSMFFSCEKKKLISKNPLKTILASEHPKIKRVMGNLDAHALQIRYTRIYRDGTEISFDEYDFQVDATSYFYPASTVKLPIALLALSKLNELEGLDRNSKFYIEGDSVTTTFAEEILKIFAVSDNDAYNRLFEFLGQDFISKALHEISSGPVRISHRLSTPEADEITTRPLIVYLNDSTTTMLGSSINTSAKPLILKDIKKGLGYIFEDSLIHKPFDFSLKNYYPIETQHHLLKTVMFPELFDSKSTIKLTNDQLDFVRTAMRTLPVNKGYDTKTYYDGYCKFFMYGDTKETIPEYMHIYNKIGEAYGTLTDCAYIQDTENKIDFLLTATILVNKNGIYNDDIYEYDEIGLPFLAELGRQVYQLELESQKNKSLKK